MKNNMPNEEVWSPDRERNLLTELIIMGSKQCSFSIIPTSEGPPKAKKNSYIYSLPADLMQEIILYYTNSMEGLFFLRTISIEWKYFAESSLIWLNCPLTFYCPAKHLLPMKNHTIWSNFEVEELKNYMIEDVNAFVDGYESIVAPIRLFQSVMDEQYISSSGVVVCDAYQQRHLLSTAYYRKASHKNTSFFSTEMCLSPTNIGDDEQGIITEEVKISETHIAPLPNRFELAKDVSHWFIFNFRTFHTNWDNSVKKIERYYSLHEVFSKYFTEYFIPICYLLTNLLFAFSIYGFTTLQKNVLRGSLEWENYLSFACVYLVGLIYLLLNICNVVEEWLSRFRKDASLTPRFVYYDAICGYDMLTIIFLAFLTTMGLLQAKSENLANDDNAALPNSDPPSFTWTTTVVPVWGAVLVCLLLFVYEYLSYSLSGKKKKFMLTIVTTLVLVAGSLQLIASHYDQHFITTLGYAIIVLFPIIFVLIVLGVSILIYIGYYWFYQGLIFLMPLTKRCFLLIGGLIYVIAIIGMIFSIVLLVFESFVGRNELPNTSTVGELAYLAVCMNAVVTIHLYFSSAKHRFTIAE